MELDHVFIFTKVPDEVAQTLKRFGLTEGSPNIHPGQGTACRRFFFQNAYLELVWVVSEEEIRNSTIAKTKLWERSQHQLTHYCPFGFCFRAEKPAKGFPSLLFADGWKYYSPFLPEDQYANVASNHLLPTEPMLFEMPFFGVAPKDYPAEKQQPMKHRLPFKDITNVSLTLPSPISDLSASMEMVSRAPIFDVAAGGEYSVCLEMDGKKKHKTKSFHPLFPLSISW